LRVAAAMARPARNVSASVPLGVSWPVVLQPPSSSLFFGVTVAPESDERVGCSSWILPPVMIIASTLKGLEESNREQF
jgi:hypothetical protein